MKITTNLSLFLLIVMELTKFTLLEAKGTSMSLCLLATSASESWDPQDLKV